MVCKMSLRKGLLAATAIATACCLATACSSGAKSPSSTGSTTPAPSGTTSKAAGAPIKVMVMLDEIPSNAAVSEPQNHAGITAGLLRINNHGGLGGSGRPVEAVYCATQLDPNAANSCVRQAESDPSILAFVGTSVAEPIDSLIETSGMANIGGLPFIAGNFTDKNLFATNAGAIAAGGGQANLMFKVMRKTKLSAGVLAIPAAVANVAIQNTVLQSCGGSPVIRTVQVPLTAADVSSYVASMAEGADGIITNTTPPQAQQYILALKRAGSSVPVALVNSQLTPATIKSMGSALTGIPVVGYYPPADSTSQGNQEYLADMAAAGQDANLNDNAENSWVALQLMNFALKGATTFTRASILQTMNNVAGFTADGLIPPLTFSAAPPNPAYPRVFNLTYYPGVVQGGKIVGTNGPTTTAVPIFC